MSKPQLISFRASHVSRIKPDAPDEWAELAKLAENQGNAYTLMAEGFPIACGGVLITSPHMAEMWGLFSPVAKEVYPKALFKAVKTRLDEIIARTGVQRIATLVDLDDSTALRFVEHLGYKPMKFWCERSA